MKTLTITNWSAWSPNLHTKEAWLTWSKKPIAPQGIDKIEAKTIPAMLKRRTSQLSKMALETANQAMENHSVDDMIFCSQHGELNRTMTLLQNITDHEILSPASFSQSVHNTASGLFSVLHQFKQNMTSLAAGENSFLMGILEAVAWLKLNSGKTVLVTMFDDYIPEEYRNLNIKSNYQYSLSMLLTNKISSLPAVSFTLESSDKKTTGELPQALEFLAWFLQKPNKPLVQSGNGQTIIWKQQ